MSLSNPRVFFGVHQVTPYNLTTKTPYGTMKVLQGSNVSMSGEIQKLVAGSNRHAWAIEDGKIETEISLTFNEYPNWAYELFLGKAPTDASADADGDVSTLTNESGTSVLDATTGIASVSAKSGSEADLKFSKYTVVAVDATTVNVYGSTDIDFGSVEYVGDSLLLNSSPLTISSGAAVELSNFGVEFTGGSGTIALTTGDTASFEVLPINTGGSSSVTIGGSSDTFPSFGLYLYGQMRGNSSSSMVELDVFNCKTLGMPINFSASEFSESEVTIGAAYSSSRNGIFSQRLLL